MPIPFIPLLIAGAAGGALVGASAKGAGEREPNSNLAGLIGAGGAATLGKDAYAEIYADILATRLEKRCNKQIAEYLGEFFDGASEAQLAALAGNLSQTDQLVREFEGDIAGAMSKFIASLEVLTKK